MAAGRDKPDVLIVNPMVSGPWLELNGPVVGEMACVKTVIPVAPPNGVAPVKAAAAPPLMLPVTFATGILSPAPSFRAFAVEK